MIGRWLIAVLELNRGWAKPVGDFLHRLLLAIFRPLWPLKDFLNGKWLGHSVHAALTDAPIGLLLAGLVFDFLDMRAAADIGLGLGVAAMLVAALAGYADFTDTDDRARWVATVHSALMVIAIVVLLVSVAMRLGAPVGDRSVAIGLALVGFLIVSASAWVGGEVVYALGNMVNRHAWRFGTSAEWARLDVDDIPEGKPTAAKAGAHSLVVVRQGETIHALHAQCAHANGPLAKGKIVDGCIECPWHGSRFELATGRRKRGPTTYDQPRYEVRAADGGGWEARRVVGSESR
ncbi:MAG TPA: Rieske (2Fe-2S) protein [Candidatus Limnocylindrales bacterium]|jgi:nitrite reductase/ring-hydroxylating ferredoxin subunit/uncharacterized membrane protein